MSRLLSTMSIRIARRCQLWTNCHLIQSGIDRAGFRPALSTELHSLAPAIVNKPQSFFHLHLISDATGETLIAAGRAASAQYKDARAIEHIYPLIGPKSRSPGCSRISSSSPASFSIRWSTRRSPRMIDQRCAEMGLPCVSVLEPVLTVFQSYLGTPAGRRVGAQHVLDAEYFRRIDALELHHGA